MRPASAARAAFLTTMRVPAMKSGIAKADKKIRLMKPKSNDLKSKEMNDKGKSFEEAIAVGLQMFAAVAAHIARVVQWLWMCVAIHASCEATDTGDSICIKSRSYEYMIITMMRGKGKVLKFMRYKIWGRSPSEVFTWSTMVDHGPP